MARSKRSPARLIVALAVAGVLAIFLIYTAIAGSTPALEPSNLTGHPGIVSLTGVTIRNVYGASVLAGNNAGPDGGLTTSGSKVTMQGCVVRDTKLQPGQDGYGVGVVGLRIGVVRCDEDGVLCRGGARARLCGEILVRFLPFLQFLN